MGNQEINLTKLFADLLALGKPVTYESMKKRMARESWLPAPFDPAAYTREIETPLLNQGWRQDGIKLLPPREEKQSKPVKQGKATSLAVARITALRRVQEILDDPDADKFLLATAIKFVQREPEDQSDIDAYLRKVREQYFKSLQKRGAEIGLAPEIIAKLEELVRLDTQNTGK